MEVNGSAMIVMAGKNCVGIASDRRLGWNKQMTVACDFQKVFQLNDRIIVGLAGLGTDVQSLRNLLRFRMNLYKLREEREMSPKAFSAMLASLLYEKRFGPYFVEPVVAGLNEDGKPFISSMDFIGAPTSAEDFVVQGTCYSQLHGMCESLYRPDMDQNALFETLSQCLQAAVDRDALSGWGAEVHIITPEGTYTRTLKSRQD